MKVKRFNEKYEFDEGGDISEEYSKLIVSHYIDNLNNGGTLQDSFDYYCEKIAETERDIVKTEIIELINKLFKYRQSINYDDNYYFKKDAKKYNI